MTPRGDILHHAASLLAGDRRQGPDHADHRNPFGDDVEAAASAGRFGMWLLLLTLGVLFAATAIAFLVMRFVPVPSTNPNPEPIPDLPPLPAIIWLGAPILIVSSITMQRAVAAARAGAGTTLTRMMTITLALGFAFLGVQTIAWTQWVGPTADVLQGANRVFLVTSFYVLTSLHAMHVIGGLIPMTVVALRARRGVYAANNAQGVEYCAMYWHFLDGVWIVLFALLLIGGA